MRDCDSIDYYVGVRNDLPSKNLVFLLLYYARNKDYIYVLLLLPSSYVIAGNTCMFPNSSNVKVQYRSVSIVVDLAQLNVTFV